MYRSVDDLKSLALGLSALAGHAGGNFSTNWSKDIFQAVLGRNYNSLLTIAQTKDNSLRVRLGALQQANSQYAIVPRTHTITFVVKTKKPSESIDTLIKDANNKIKGLNTSFQTLLSINQTDLIKLEGDTKNLEQNNDLLNSIKSFIPPGETPFKFIYSPNSLYIWTEYSFLDAESGCKPKRRFNPINNEKIVKALIKKNFRKDEKMQAMNIENLLNEFNTKGWIEFKKLFDDNEAKAAKIWNALIDLGFQSGQDLITIKLPEKKSPEFPRSSAADNITLLLKDDGKKSAVTEIPFAKNIIPKDIVSFLKFKEKSKGKNSETTDTTKTETDTSANSDTKAKDKFYFLGADTVSYDSLTQKIKIQFPSLKIWGLSDPESLFIKERKKGSDYPVQKPPYQEFAVKYLLDRTDVKANSSIKAPNGVSWLSSNGSKLKLIFEKKDEKFTFSISGGTVNIIGTNDVLEYNTVKNSYELKKSGSVEFEFSNLNEKVDVVFKGENEYGQEARLTLDVISPAGEPTAKAQPVPNK